MGGAIFSHYRGICVRIRTCLIEPERRDASDYVKSEEYMKQVAPLSGWLLNRAVEIDEECPGFAGALIRASLERRHVTAAYLSLHSPRTKFGSVSALGEFLVTATHDDILRAGYGFLPSGLRGALGRGGRRPHPRRFYRYLHAIMASSARPETKRMILALEHITPGHLKIARALPSDLRLASLVETLEDVDDARALAILIDLLVVSGLERGDLRRALKSVSSQEMLHRFAASWAFKVTLPPHPVAGSDHYIPVAHASELRRLALKHRNCARRHLANVLEGHVAFATYRSGTKEAVIHLVRDEGGWHLDQIYGTANTRPASELAAQAMAHLARHGVVLRRSKQRPPSPWDSLRRLAGFENFQAAPDEF